MNAELSAEFGEVVPVRRVSRRRTIGRFVRRPTNAFAVLVLLVGAVFAALPVAALPHDPFFGDLILRLQPPAWSGGGTGDYLLGTDTLGRDVLSRVMHGARYSLTIALLAALVSMTLGVTLGLVAGYYGGRLDSAIMRLADIQFAFPVVILLIAVVGVIGTGYVQLVAVLGLTGWASYARIVRGSTLAVRQAEYIEAARALGARSRRVMLRDVLPNVGSEIIVLTSFLLGQLILLESGLSFLGLGIQPPTPSWGGMVGDARAYLDLAWWVLAFPGGAIALTVLAFNFLGDGLRDAFDPYTRQIGSLPSARSVRRRRREEKAASAAPPPRRDVEPVLSIRDLVAELQVPAGVIRAVDGVSLDVYPGEVVGLVGESGSGKSITALSVLGLLPRRVGRIVGGTVTLRGATLTGMSRRKLREVRGRDVGIVFQDPLTSLNPVMTVGAQIIEAIRTKQPRMSRTAARRRALELLELVGVPNPSARLAQYPHEFSGGMRQRVMFALAIANRPPLLIADEPTTALDVTIQAQILEVLKTARRETQASVLLITHDLGVVAELADRVAVMYAGRIVEVGSVYDIFHCPKHPYTVGLLDSLPRLRAELGRLVPIPGSPPGGLTRPDGCPFRPRCPVTAGRAICAVEMPPLDPVGDGHLAACHFPDEVGPPTSRKGRAA
jgi:peptide/nickel transport system permease protein